jgi:pimeloyl-ACP methyl ester carboxylesterase
VDLFMATVGVPRPFVILMHFLPFWKDARATAHTLPYDAAVTGDFAVPAAAFASIRVPVLAVAGAKTQPVLKRAVQAVADLVPGARHRIAPGMHHALKPALLAPLVRSWLESSGNG